MLFSGGNFTEVSVRSDGWKERKKDTFWHSLIWWVTDLFSCQAVNAITPTDPCALPTISFTHKMLSHLCCSLLLKRWKKTVPSFCLCNFHTGKDMVYWCKIPAFKSQCEWGDWLFRSRSCMTRTFQLGQQKLFTYSLLLSCTSAAHT